MKTVPVCKKCDGRLYFGGYARMGGSHSNYYKCKSCDRVVEISDRDLPYIEPQVLTRKF